MDKRKSKSPLLRVKPSDMTRSARRRQQRRRQQSARAQRWSELREIIERAMPQILSEPDDEWTRRELRAAIDRLNKLHAGHNPYDQIVFNLIKEGYWTRADLVKETGLRMYLLNEILDRLIKTGKVKRQDKLYVEA